MNSSISSQPGIGRLTTVGSLTSARFAAAGRHLLGLRTSHFGSFGV
jgi:hypothetical protein